MTTKEMLVGKTYKIGETLKNKYIFRISEVSTSEDVIMVSQGIFIGNLVPSHYYPNVGKVLLKGFTNGYTLGLASEEEEVHLNACTLIGKYIDPKNLEL